MSPAKYALVSGSLLEPEIVSVHDSLEQAVKASGFRGSHRAHGGFERNVMPLDAAESLVATAAKLRGVFS